MLFLMNWLPPPLAAGTIAVAHAAVLLDIAIRRDLPWWQRLVTGVIVAFLLPLGALAYLLVRPVGARMRRRIADRHAALAAKGWVAPSRWRRTLARGASVAGVTIALVASATASSLAAPTSPFAGENYGIALLNLPAAWPTSTGRGVTVAVVDSGVDATNAFLAPRLVPGHDFADGTGSTKDGEGHGTHVAGIVAQVAPDARIMPVKVLDSAGRGSTQTFAAGVLWAADHGAGVINLSIDQSGILAQIEKEGSLNDAVAYANAKGSVVVAAAGNGHQDLQVYKLGVPVITVAAVDQSRHPASFTNWGGPAEVATPGVAIWSTAPQYPTTLFPDGTDGTAVLDGTSMATPFVSGVAALLRAQGATPAATQAALLNTAQPVAGVNILGHGIINPAAALSYANAHPHPQVAADFAPLWYRWTQFTLLAAVLVKYSWALIQMWRRRRAGPLTPIVDLAVSVAG
jgi:subtilisin family serine protease